MTTTPPSSLPSRPNRQAELAQVLRWQASELAQHPSADQLQLYVEAQLRGLPYQTDHADLAHHLDGCVACAEAYGRLYELMLAEEQATVALPERIPAADLAFLQPLPQTTWLAQIRAAIKLVGQQLTLQLSPDLLPGLQPTLAGGTLRAPSDEERYHEQILALDDEALPLNIAAYRDGQQPAHCLLEITVTPPDRSWPDLADIVVTLHIAGGRRSAVTDAWGLAVFADVPIEQLAEMQVTVDLSFTPQTT